MDGEMQFETSTNQTYRGERGDRGDVTRHQDNLKLEGKLGQYGRIRSCGFLRIFTYTDDVFFRLGKG